MLAAGLLAFPSIGDGRAGPGAGEAAGGAPESTVTVAHDGSSLTAPSGTPGIAGGGRLRYATRHGLVKVRPEDPVEGGQEIELTAARNEFEAFQLLLRSSTELEEIDVEVGELTGPGTIPADSVTVYRVDTLTLQRPSSDTGARGDWPDPLVPRVDRYYGERRSAFPFSLPANRTRSIWIEVYVPVDTPPGRYHGTAIVSAGGEPWATVPVRLRVWPFALPSTSSYDSSFGLSGLSILDAHFGDYTDDEDLYAVTRLYTEAALRHRISTHGGTMIPPRGRRLGDGWHLYWEDYDREIGPFLEGTVLEGSDPLPGARATSVMVRTPTDLSGEDRVAYWRSWAEHFDQRGWLDRLFLYLWDEPQGPLQRTPSRPLNLALARLLGEPVTDYPELGEMARDARRADPRLVTSVTEQLVASLDEVVDRWIPLVNCLQDKPGHPSYCEETVSRDAYPPPGTRDRPWFYQSCGSHSCDDRGGEYFSGWPTYMIDAPAVGNRVMQWIAWRYRIGGELYHNTTRAFGLVPDPWQSVYAHGGNGDGTFFYPGRPDVIGGEHHIPVESLRLKLLRDGLEDFEYLTMLAEAGERELADEIAHEIAPATYRWEGDPDRLLQARHRLGERLAEITASSSPR